MREMTLKQPLYKIALFLMGIQVVVFYAHWIVYETLAFAFMPRPKAMFILQVVLFVLSLLFLILQVLINKFKARFLNLPYTIMAMWLGTMHFLFMACIVFWIIAAAMIPFGGMPPFDEIGSILFVIALILSVYGAIRSFRPHYTRYYVNIPNLPAEWRGRKAVFFSDMHLGNIRGAKSARKAVDMTNAENPDIVFIPGDLFDGPPADYASLIAPLADLKAPHGVYFTEGNHEEFRDPTPYLEVIRGVGIKVLNKEMVVIDGMQILGVPYDDSNEPEEVRDSLAAIPFNPKKPSILLKHAPSSVRAVAVAGVSLMLSGHTHNAQVWPYKFFVRRLFGKASYGHSEMNNMQTITTSGFGTWGPPQRFGTKAEVVVIKFS
jgi:hypothetical protein